KDFADGSRQDEHHDPNHQRRKVFYYEGIPRPATWSLAVFPIPIFALLTTAGDDALPRAAPEAKPLNGRGTVLVVVDTLRADALGIYGAAEHDGAPITPNLDAFSERGVVFDDVTAQASWTRPAVASLLTSRHVSGHQTMRKSAILPDSLVTVAEAMQSSGKKTAAVVTNYNLEAGYGFAQGFDQYRYLAPARYLGAPERANRLAAYNVYRVIREKLITAGREARFFYRDGQVVNAVGMEMLDTIGNEEFFLYLHYMEPHDPYFGKERSFARVAQVHPPAALKDEMLAAYRDEVRRFDQVFGELLTALEARGLRDRVDIVVTADHGEEFMDHGGWWHGETLYQEQIHIPLIAAGPSFAPSRVSDIARQIDIAPTLAAAAGVSAPDSWEGRDLMDASLVVDVAIAEENHNGNELTAIRKGSIKLLNANPNNPRGVPEQEAFDLATDPGEQAALPESKVPLSTLSDLLEQGLKSASEGGAVAEERDLTPEQEAELRALGYVQ
ncbi:MAG: sulfatase, partial [Myxococcota bacterium]